MKRKELDEVRIRPYEIVVSVYATKRAFSFRFVYLILLELLESLYTVIRAH